MKILLIGDVFAKPGRHTLAMLLPETIEQYQPDLIIANAENLHHGKGISDAKIRELKSYGVNFFTSGNHIWKVPEIIEYLNQQDYPLIRPANYPEGSPGRGYAIIDTPNKNKVAIINLMGRVYMPANLDCPFRKADQILQEITEQGYQLGQNLQSIIVDFHAEAGSEKMALAHYLDGRVTAVVGTHTHIPTADQQILPKGTGYQTDLGMTGVINSVIGTSKEGIIENFLTQRPVKHLVAEGPTVFNSLLVTTSSQGLAASVERIQKFLN